MESKLYKQATDLNQMAVFEWDILKDTLTFDEMMKVLTQHEIPRENVKEHLLKARLIHPKDRQEFQNHVNRILNFGTNRAFSGIQP